MNGDLRKLVREVERARQSVIGTVQHLSSQQAAFKPSDGGWSVVEVVEHLCLAEMSGLAKIWLAAYTVRSGHSRTTPNPNGGKSIEQLVADTWKLREVAPPIATPHIGGPLTCWIEAFRSLTQMLAAVQSQLDGLTPTDVVFPHYLSGPMDAVQRLTFLRYHMERHLAQIQGVMSDPAFP
jgi:hypothetical protein